MTKSIALRGKYGQGKFALVDDTDHELFSEFRWFLYPTGYVYRKQPTRKGKTVYLHREVMNAPKGKEVDHRNGNRLDNTRDNLRLVSSTQNKQNSAPRKNTVSRYKGVTFAEQMWRARIVINYKSIVLGFFSTQREAALAYNEAAKEHFGEYARLNEVIDDPEDTPIQFPETLPSHYHGICWDKRRQKWMVRIKANGIHMNLGRFSDEIEAAKAYDAAAREYHGDKAKLNFLE